ncbi:MAG: hypothetical protein L3J77_03555, partial [Thermoplasmata archaeon]|nr:hypothetical protein [Thermoplasmata archaeon]
VPNEVRERFDGWPSATFEARTRDAIQRLGFSVAAETPIALGRARAPRAGHDPKKLAGIWVGERNLRLDAALRKRADRKTAGWVIAGIVIFVLVVVFLPARPYFILGPLIGGLCLGVALAAYTGRGAFDSELVYVVAETSPNLPPGTTLTPEMPLTLEVRSGSARITSMNWAGRHSRGRLLKAVLPPGIGPSGTPADLLRLVRG